MADRSRGLYGKYKVERMDRKPISWCFVLEPERDPHALVALAAYADSVVEDGYEALATDIRLIIDSMQELDGETT